MTEAKLNKNVVDALNKLPGVFVRKRFGGVGQKGQPDITGIARGIRVEIEGKLPGKKPTPKQKYWLDLWGKYGAITGVYHSESEAIHIVATALTNAKK
jgi:hypothetical protein